MLTLPRLASLAAFAAIAAIATFAAVDRLADGTPRATLRPISADSNFTFVVREAPAGDVLHVGDRVRIESPAELAAYQYHALAAGSTLDLQRIAPGAPQPVAEPLVVRSGQGLGIGAIVLVLQLFFLGVATLVVARGRQDGSLQLGWLLALTVMTVNPAAAVWPPWIVLAYAVGGGTLVVVAFACAADFATRFTGDGDAAWARRVRRVAIGFALAGGLLEFGVSLDSFLAPTTPVVWQTSTYAVIVIQAALFIVALVLAYRRTGPVERQKALWVALSLATGIVGFLATVLLGVLGFEEPLRDVPLILLVAMPLGCAYAILRYRLLDIGFVVNRATVFGVTSLLVLAALALIDFGLQNWLGSWLVRTGLTVQLVLALGIGIATRPLHHQVDRFVDDLFFRKRHEAEAALRAFARDVAYIDDPALVVERTVATIAERAELRAAAFLADAQGYVWVRTSAPAPPVRTIERNDAAVVRMLATRTHVDLHNVPTLIRGDYAVPMFARGRLAGFIVCGEKTDGVEAYAPDELDAISSVVTAAGLSLDLLRIEQLEGELEAIRRGAVPLPGGIV